MRKIRIITMLVCIVTVVCALALTANAKWWDDNPFTDVKSSHWYYDAVRITNENGIFNGTNETTFAPSGKMTRAMLVQALASADGFDKDDYAEGTPFTDVKASHWFAPAVEWAYKNNITSGKTADKFAPNDNITREQLASMLFRYACYKGIEIADTKEFSSFPDASKVAAYAKESFEWAYGNGIISGSKKGGELYLNPRNTATRAECAQMFSSYLYLAPSYTINGNDISLYKIVYSATENKKYSSIGEMSKYLADMIEGSLGYRLPVVTDETEISEYEILVGKTNREDEGLVEVDRDSFADDQVYIWSVQGNYLVIAGIDSTYEDNTAEDRSYTTVRGTRNGVFKFCEEELGAYEYIDNEDEDGLIVYETDPVISLPDGYYHEDMTWYRKRVFYMKGNVNATGDYMDYTSHNMSTWISGDWGSEEEVHHDPTPCMSKEENIQAVIEHVKEVLAADSGVSVLGIGINDSLSYCRGNTGLEGCHCAEIYNEYDARSATLCLLVNRVSEAIAEEYPDVYFLLGAYEYCQKPPVGLELRDNIMVEFFTVKNCSGHAYNDPDCSLNRTLADYYKGWDDISSGGNVIWDHTGGFKYFMTPQPDWDSLLENVRFFADGGAREMLMNSVFYGEELPNGEGPSKHADLGDIRGYMLSMIYMDPYMSEEEYYYRLDGCLKGNYGDGWKNIREYIDIISELGNAKCHNFHTPASGHFDMKSVSDLADHIDSLWADAKAKAKTDLQKQQLALHENSWLYLKQCATYESRYTNGTEEQRAEYVRLNNLLYDNILDMRLLWTEGTLNPLDNFDETKDPTTW